ncbi:hypothetical protein Tco_0763396 [Tanacetum coccineum]
MTSFDYRLNPIYAIKECSSCGSLYTSNCGCSKGSLEDKILVPIPDSSQRSFKIENFCLDCGDPIHGLHCQGCALIQKTFEEVLQDFQDTSKSSDDNTNVVNAPREPFVVNQDPGENSSPSPPHIDHCCHECGNSLDGIFCRQCTCKSCGKGAHYGYNCPPKVPIISNPEPMHTQKPLVSTYKLTMFTKQFFWYMPNKCGLQMYTMEFVFIVQVGTGTQSILQLVSSNDFQVLPKTILHNHQYVPILSYYHEQNSCYDYNSFGFDPFQPPQYTVNHPIFNSQNELLNSSNKLMEQMATLCDLVGQAIQKKEEEERIAEDQAAKDRYWKIPICYDDDEDDTCNTPFLQSEEPIIIKIGRIDDDILLTIKDDILREKLLNVNLLIAKIDALRDNPTPSSEVNSCGSTTTRSDYSLPDYEAFYFDNDHIEEKSSGSTTTYSNISLSKYDSFIFDLSNDPFPPADWSDFYHEEFSDELAHIISHPDLKCFYFKIEPNPGDLIDLGIRENLSSTTNVNLPFEDA